MPEYNGNAIHDYLSAKTDDYFFSVENNWFLLYGDENSIPKLLVFVNKTEDIQITSDREKYAINLGCKIAKYLKLPFICVRFMPNNSNILVWRSKEWKISTYDELRDMFKNYGLVKPGTAAKKVNQYLSSSYHDWQRNNLGNITVCDLDMVKYSDNKIEKIVELKRSKISLDKWTPYSKDNSNFALIANAIVNSKADIAFFLYYNKMEDGEIGKRIDDISKIKVFKSPVSKF